MHKNKTLLFVLFFVSSLLFIPLGASADNQDCVTGIGGVCQAGSCGAGTTENTGFICPGGDKCCVASNAGGNGGNNAPGNSSKAGLQYQLLEKIPGTSGLGSDLPSYVGAIYKVALVIVILSAILMLTIGGFMYLTSAGNTASMGTAKGIIYDSLIGLIIALSAWLILYVINPDLVAVSLKSFPPVAVTSGPSASPASIGALPSGSDSELAKKILGMSSITLNNTGSCSSSTGPVSPTKNIADIADGNRAAVCSNNCQTKGNSGCQDNSISLSNKMLAAIVAVGEKNQFTITSIGGGAHASNSAHYSGNAIDITPVNQTLLDAFVKAGAFAPNGNAASMCEQEGKNVGCSGGGANHIHLIFPH